MKCYRNFLTEKFEDGFFFQNMQTGYCFIREILEVRADYWWRTVEGWTLELETEDGGHQLCNLDQITWTL